ncbi:MAG: low molecular weight phosphatase family protein [Deltaproteobacteria bacterium]
MTLPQSILFCCDQNSVRSPMAEALMKRMFGTRVYVQSAGVQNERDIDGFAIAVCHEVDVELARHRSRSFDDMQAAGEDVAGFDLIVALSTASHRRALDLTRAQHVTVEFWDVLDPTGIGENRDTKLSAYRMTRQQILAHLEKRFHQAIPVSR